MCRRAAESGVTLLVEEHVAIDFELSALVVRRPGETLAWPVVETTQVDGVCREVLHAGPGDAGDRRRRPGASPIQIADSVELVGVMAVEMFASGGRLMVNEVALRPHNSGHWTIEGAVTSQFENHVAGGASTSRSARPTPVAPHVATVNVFGPADGSDPVHSARGRARRQRRPRPPLRQGGPPGPQARARDRVRRRRGRREEPGLAAPPGSSGRRSRRPLRPAGGRQMSGSRRSSPW